MYNIKNSDIEAQHALLHVAPIKLIKLRLLLAIFLSIVTALIFALLLKWSNKLYQQFLFEFCDEAVCTHYLVTTITGEKCICKKVFANNNPMLIFRLLKYQFNHADKLYYPVDFIQPGKSLNESRQLSQQSRLKKIALYGNCELTIPIIPLHEYLFGELTGPFYILQYFSVVLWIAEGFLLFSIVLMCSSLLACLINYALLRRSRYQLQRLALINADITLEDGIIIEGRCIVPGDIIKIEVGMLMNCDCILISGDVMMNEATLTGESVPIPKAAMIQLDQEMNWETHNIHCLYEGSKVVRVSDSQDNLALVLRTGFSSLRGQYFRNVLFPEQNSLYFYVQAVKFLLGLSVIVLLVYFLMLIRWIDMEYSASMLVIRFFDVITWVIPPALPIFFSLSQTAGLIKLAQLGVIGQNPNKVETAGRIDTVCFDKTGTLTTLGLTAQECWPLNNVTQQVMSCCHHIGLIKQDLIGDPLELEMFKFSGWDIQFDQQQYFKVTHNDQTLQVLRIFEFTSHKQMMSVIAIDQNNKQYLFTKGSPEQLQRLAKHSIDDLKQQVQLFTCQGLRVLCLAMKEITMDQAQEDRESLEQNLELVGLFTVENKLKQDTPSVISQLKQSKLDIKVISGDNPLTTLHCGQLAGIVNKDVPHLIINYDQNAKEIQITSNTQDNGGYSIGDILGLQFKNDVEIAITGPLWEHLYLTDNPNTNEIRSSSISKIQQIQFNDDDQQQNVNKLHRLVNISKVFARMKPHQKKEVVQTLQQMGRQVVMVGDGANDCSAIAQAQIGISFQSTDASYTAPFSSQNDSIGCVISVLTVGRCTICIIIEIFQYYITVSMLKFICTMILSLQAMNFGDFQFIYINYMSAIPYLIFLTVAQPTSQLNNQIPLDNMFAKPNQLAIYNQIFTSAIGLIIIGVVLQIGQSTQWYPPITEYNRIGLLNTTIFLSNLFLNMTVGFTIYTSLPFKEYLFWNIPLCIWTFLCLGVSIVLLIWNELGGWLDIVDIDDEAFPAYKYLVLFILIVTAVVSIINQEFLKIYYPVVRTLG